MSVHKWIYILLFGGFILIGMLNAANSEEETDPSSVEECRVHIEKALEQYWDAKGPSESTPTDYVTHINNDEKDERSSETLQEREEEDQDDVLTNNEVPQIQKENDIDEDENDDEDDEEDDDDDDEDEDDDDEPDHNNDNDKNLESSENDEHPVEPETETEDKDQSDQHDESLNKEGKQQQNSIREDTSGDTESVEEVAEDSKSTEFEEDKDVSDDDDDDDDDDDENAETNENEDVDDDEETDENEDIEENTESAENEDVNDNENSKENGNKEDIEDEDEDEEEFDRKVEEISEEKTKLRAEEDISNTLKIVLSGSNLSLNESEKETSQVATAVPFRRRERVEEEELPQVEDNVTIAEDSESEQRLEESEPDTDEKDDDTIENIYDDETDDAPSTAMFRSREHVDVILNLDGEDKEFEREEEKLAQSILREIRKIETTSIRPIEMLYKYADSTSRVLGDAEIFNKPMLLFLGPWNSGKTSIINYILGIENTPTALKTGTGITDTDFTIITSGERHRVVSGTELAADWRYAGTQKFGQGFLDHFRSIHIENRLLDKVNIVDTPGILENRKNTERGYSFNEVFQWFIDRADAIYVVLDPAKVDIGAELGSVIEQLKGRDARFILNKADTIRRSDLMRVVGQLFWNLSPLMSSTEAPIIYAVSLTSRPYHPSAPAKFLADQEKNFLYDMKSTLGKQIENRILYARKHAVRVRNHAKMVDCFLATFYRHKSIFSSKRNIAKLITENPKEYNIFDSFNSITNVSRFDLPSPQTYKEFFKVHPLYDFKPLASTCSYFRGCPMEKLDQAIAKDIPELLAKYKKSKMEIPKPER